MKARLSSLDTRAIANELDARLSNKYIQNFYSYHQRFMYIKFSNHDILLLEPGVSVRLTTTHDTEISHFCRKLREYCRHARVRSIYQYTFDRIIVLDISRCKIVVEMFSGGNILIIDNEDNIIDLLRPVPTIGITKGTKYIWNPVELELSFNRYVSNTLDEILPFEKEFIAMVEAELIEKFGPLETIKDEKYKDKLDEYFNVLTKRIEKLGGFGQVIYKNRKPEQFFAFSTVSGDGVYEYAHPVPVFKDKVEPGIPTPKGENLISTVESSLNNLTLERTEREANLEGEKAVENVNGISHIKTEEVSRIFSKNKGITAINFPTLNEVVDFVFSDRKKTPKVKQDKVERIKQAQMKYIEELQGQAEDYTEIANLLERNRTFVGDILSIFSKVYENRIKWDVFDVFWKEEKRRGNQHSLAITSYNLEEHTAIIMIEDTPVEIRVDQSLSQIISGFYAKKRKAESKAVKTEEAMNNIVSKLAPKNVPVKAQKRAAYWFERYHWFFTSDGTLVIGGKNAQENERVVKTHMEKNDLYFHCEVHGASSVICKGRSETAVKESAYAALVLSKCWDDGIIKRVFYVEPEQVSKSAPTGEYLAKGGFSITGRKNFLDPYRLEYGIGLLFKESGSKPLEFSGIPGPSILHSLPVCAPWQVIKNYKYKARLCPGNEKKSVLGHSVQKLFIELCKNMPEEAAVKAVGIDEYINVLFNKGRIGKIVK
ncbi:nuclear export mediator factor NEMF [Pancytospora epiphaga]|nr:nuclear export mediator factor NEMF [Pancytospora epiphaga]